MFCLQEELFLTQNVNIIQNKIHDIAWPFLFVEVGYMQYVPQLCVQRSKQSTGFPQVYTGTVPQITTGSFLILSKLLLTLLPFEAV
jgi:hypothetical protein